MLGHHLLGWDTQDQQMPAGADCPPMTYTMAGPKGQPYKVAGMMQMDGPQFEGVPPHWMGYITVEDVDSKAKQVEKLGGKIMVPPMDIPNVGRFTVIQDPTGAVVSLITLAQM